MIRIITFAAATALLVVPLVVAQIPGRKPAPVQERIGTRNQLPQQPDSAAASVDDTLFSAAAACGSMGELSLSRIGQERATDALLKQFSERMIVDHTRLSSELKAIASGKGMALPHSSSYAVQFCEQSLQGLSGGEFDRCYAQAQLLAHMQAVAIFEAEAKRGGDQDLAAFARRALPVIKEHLRTIKPIASKYSNQDDESEATHAIKQLAPGPVVGPPR
jgi:putative membrane protein